METLYFLSVFVIILTILIQIKPFGLDIFMLIILAAILTAMLPFALLVWGLHLISEHTSKLLDNLTK